MAAVPINFVEQLMSIEEFCGTDQPIRRDVPAGSARFDVEFAMLEFTCPCGCGFIHCVPYSRVQQEKTWLWNGDFKKPSLVPSIQVATPCKWHGHLMDGVWQSY